MVLILYISNDPSSWPVLVKSLTSRGFVVEVARDGLEGVKKARELQPDLILMDLYLPRMDGLDVIHQLKSCSLTWDIPTIFLSVFPAHYSRWLADETGAQGYIPKPFGVEEVMDVIRRYLPRRPGLFSTAAVN